MPYGGPAWLAQTQEEILEPQIPICDPHHHLWDAYFPEFIPYQRYRLEEFVADIGTGHNVRCTVFLQARVMYRKDGPPEMQPVGEVEFAQGQAAASASGLYGPCRVAAAIVGHTELKRGDKARPVLEALLAASPNRLRGVRDHVAWDPHPVHWNGRPKPAGYETPGLLPTAEFRAGARALSQMGLSLDLHASVRQLPELADFARALPDLTIVLNHLGGVSRVGHYAGKDEEVMAVWRTGIAAAAECPNVHIKLGGVGMPQMGFGWHERGRPVGSEELASTIAPFLETCIERFGPDRCMFEANFPPDKISFSYPVVFNAFKRFSKGYSATERAAMFHDTAVRVYRIDQA